jgi:hypothetical protein
MTLNGKSRFTMAKYKKDYAGRLQTHTSETAVFFKDSHSIWKYNTDCYDVWEDATGGRPTGLDVSRRRRNALPYRALDSTLLSVASERSARLRC